MRFRRLAAFCFVFACTVFSANCLTNKENKLLGLVNEAIENSQNQDKHYIVATSEVVEEFPMERERLTTKTETVGRKPSLEAETGALRTKTETVGHVFSNGEEVDAYIRSVETRDFESSGSVEIVSESAFIDGQFWEKDSETQEWKLSGEQLPLDARIFVETVGYTNATGEVVSIRKEDVNSVTDEGKRSIGDTEVRCVKVNTTSSRDELPTAFKPKDGTAKSALDAVKSVTKSVSDVLVVVSEYCISEEERLLVRVERVTKLSEGAKQAAKRKLPSSFQGNLTTVHSFNEEVDILEIAGIVTEAREESSSAALPLWSSVFAVVSAVFAMLC